LANCPVEVRILPLQPANQDAFANVRAFFISAIPFYFLVIHLIINKQRIRIPLAITIACLGALSRLMHGYMILLLGDRLF